MGNNEWLFEEGLPHFKEEIVSISLSLALASVSMNVIYSEALKKNADYSLILASCDVMRDRFSRILDSLNALSAIESSMRSENEVR